MAKAQLRAQLISKRQLLDNMQVAQMSNSVYNSFLKLADILNFKHVLTYIPINNEVDTGLINRYFKENNSNLYLPAFFENRWSVCKWTDDELKKGPFETLQPEKKFEAHLETLDMVLVPGVAFSKSGVRLGYGKGVYDQLLKGSRAVKIGLAYDFQIFDEICKDEFDIKMDFVVTQAGFLKIT